MTSDEQRFEEAPLSSGKMSTMLVKISYDGEWETMSDGVGRVYTGRKTKSLIIEKTITYIKLVQAIYELLEVDPTKHKIQLACQYKSFYPTPECAMPDDYSVECFVHYHERLDPEKHLDYILPICVTLVPCHPSSHSPSAYGSNQVSDKVLLVSSSMQSAQFEDLSPSPDQSNLPSDACSSTTGTVRRGHQYGSHKSKKGMFDVNCTKDACQRQFCATKVKNIKCFQMRRMNNLHTCRKDQVYLNRRQPPVCMVGKIIKSKYDSVNRIYRLKDVVDNIIRQFSIDISYCKAWRARQSILTELTGFAEESFAILPGFCKQLENQNPGTITAIETDDNSHFQYFFMALGPSLRGFRSHIRKVIAVNSVFMRGKYFGTLVVAVCLDGNNQIYPLAFGVGDIKNDASWLWFFTKLQDAIGDVKDLVIISEQHKSIEKAMNLIFPTAHHGVCCWHLKWNMLTKFKKSTIEELYWKAAKAHRRSDFNEHMVRLQAISNDAFKYLHDIGFSKWARSHFIDCRYNIMTINISESMKNILKYAYALPITMLAEYLRATLQKWFYDRHNMAQEMSFYLTCWATLKVSKRNRKSKTWNINPVSNNIFQVCDDNKDGLVDLQARTCTCRKWQLSQLPCDHVMAVCRYLSLGDYHQWCDNVFTREWLIAVYSEPIMPLGHHSEWVISDEVQDKVVLPPVRQSLV